MRNAEGINRGDLLNQCLLRLRRGVALERGNSHFLKFSFYDWCCEGLGANRVGGGGVIL